MKTLDLSSILVTYNLVIGVLIALSSDKVASLAGRLGERVGAFTKLATVTFGLSVAVLSAVLLVVVHILRIGVDQ